MSSIDIRAEVRELQGLIGLRVANIYDLTPKLFIIKLSRPDSKAHLLIEPGIRLHTTNFAREKPPAPSPFTSKLRKFLRTRRLIKIEQLGIDRVINFTFTSGEEEFHIILELYAQGNLLFTDQNYVILALLRSHTFEEDVKYAKGEVYPFDHAAGLKFVDEIDKAGLEERINKYMESQDKKKGTNFKQLLAGIEPYMHFPLAEHCLKAAGCTSVNKKVSKADYELIEKAVAIAHSVVNAIDNGSIQGVLAFDTKQGHKSYYEFSPVIFAQFPQDSVEVLETFDKAVDQFFSVVEKQKAEITQEKQEQEVWKKKNRIEEDQERRLNGLIEEQTLSEKKAKIIHAHVEELDFLFGILKNCLATGVSWDELLRMIIEEKSRGNPYAALVKKFRLEKNIVEVNLKDPDSEEIVKIDVDISKNAFQNARDYYDNKRASAVKEIKTKDHIQKVVKEADKKAKIELQKQQMKLGTGVRAIRKVYWWEKFNWFISSENYLVISGKDAQQNEIIVKKYMKKGDIYVHADMHGASSTVIKNPSGLPIPQCTLEEAGTFCVCLSSAWNSKIIQSAWWVYDNQVSKTAPTGLYLSIGSFMIRGKKNFLHPSKLEMSIVLLFKLDENSLINHLGERAVKEAVQNIEIKNQIEEKNEDEWTISATSFNQKTQKSEKKEKKQKDSKEPKEKNNEKGKNGKKEEVKEPAQKIVEDPKKNKPLTAQQLRKLKKIKEKYSEQTEEEKQARLKLLGSKEVKFSYSLDKPNNSEKNEKIKENKKIEEKESLEDLKKHENDEYIEKSKKIEETALTAPNDSEVDLTIGSMPSLNTEEVPKSQIPEEEENSSSSEKNLAEGLEGEKKVKDKKEIQLLLDEENILGEEELKALGEADSLTGQPAKDDTLLFCVPMCAPHISTNSYKYRIKLVPGNLKKGKAVSLLTYTWLNLEGITETEKQLIKSMNETDLITVLPGKVSIASAAVKKIQQTSKKNKG